jgi:hypothetical protein
MAKDKEKKIKEKKIKKPRFKEIRDAYAVTKAVKPWIGLMLASIVIGVTTLGVVLGILLSDRGIIIFYGGFVALPSSFILALFLFTRIAGAAAYASIEGQIGAGASVLMAIRKGWTTTPAVAVNRSQDMVHRSVGRGGIVLVGEGSSLSSVQQMLRDERKKSERYAPGAPVTPVTPVTPVEARPVAPCRPVAPVAP